MLPFILGKESGIVITKRIGTSQKQWLDQWDVTGSIGDEYVVSLKADGTYACSCPRWKFHKAPKVDCKHISAVTGVTIPVKNKAGSFTYLKNAAKSAIAESKVVKRKRPVEKFAEKFFPYSELLRTGNYSFDALCRFAEEFAKESGGVIDDLPEPETVDTGEFKITRKFRLVS
jgi:hypothetical protein